MKRACALVLMLACCTMIANAKSESNPANFSGTWVLDFGQTKNPPAGLQNYTIVVKQDQQQLKVETTLKGNPQAPPDDNSVNPGGNYPGGGGGYPGGRRGGMGGMGMPGRIGSDVPGGMGGSGGGMPSSGRGRPRGEGRGQGVVAAYKLYPQNAVYKLDGSESTAQLGDSAGSDATLKAELSKGGEQIKLSMVGNEDPGQKGGKVELKDQWKLSRDGQALFVDRSIKSPEGSGSVHLVFVKQEAGTTSGAEEEK